MNDVQYKGIDEIPVAVKQRLSDSVKKWFDCPTRPTIVYLYENRTSKQFLANKGFKVWMYELAIERFTELER